MVAALPSMTPWPVHKSSTDGCSGKARTLQVQAQGPEVGMVSYQFFLIGLMKEKLTTEKVANHAETFKC